MSEALKTCDHHDCCPVEQVRGEMKAGEYYDIIAAHSVSRFGTIEHPEKYGHPLWPGQTAPEGMSEHCVEMNNDIATNFRICCKTCGKATGWGARDFPGMPGAGADYIRKKWNE
jgi:hypothetical protein